MSLERAETLAFAGRLAAAEAAVGRAEVRSDPDRFRRAWLRAYLAAAQGRFTLAERAARSLLGEPLEAAMHARAATTLGSVLRQTGRHAEARVVERAALARRPRGDERTHLLIGLVADAVGLGDLPGVDHALRRVGSRPPDGWRVHVRLAWVRCERELLAGRPVSAARLARRARAIAERAGARRHVAKSSLFLGASLLEAGDGAGGASALRAARTIAHRIGAAPIEQVAVDLLGRDAGRR